MSDDAAPSRPPRGDDQSGDTPQGNAAPRGADLAREALDAARARNAAARSAARTRGRRGTSGGKDGGSAMLRLRRRRWSGPGPDAARDPQPFGATAAAWIARADTGGEVVKARLFERWAQIVGAAVADHCAPTSLVDGELVVQAESTAWATQLRLISARLIATINKEIGPNTVHRIRTRGPSGPSWRFGNRHVSGRGPRDTYG